MSLRLPVPKSRLVTLTLVAALLTALVAGALAAPVWTGDGAAGQGLTNTVERTVADLTHATAAIGAVVGEEQEEHPEAEDADEGREGDDGDDR